MANTNTESYQRIKYPGRALDHEIAPYDHAENRFMARAIQLSLENVQTGQGGPFGAVIVRNGVLFQRA